MGSVIRRKLPPFGLMTEVVAGGLEMLSRRSSPIPAEQLADISGQRSQQWASR